MLSFTPQQLLLLCLAKRSVLLYSRQPAFFSHSAKGGISSILGNNSLEISDRKDCRVGLSSAVIRMKLTIRWNARHSKFRQRKTLVRSLRAPERINPNSSFVFSNEPIPQVDMQMCVPITQLYPSVQTSGGKKTLDWWGQNGF